MGAIETEYMEIRQLTQQLLAGTISPELGAVVFKGYAESGKRLGMYIKTVALQMQSVKAGKDLISKNIISKDTAIDCNSIQIEERIKCPEQGDAVIGRYECLDYSGNSANIENCQKCKHFSITRKRVCPSRKES